MAKTSRSIHARTTNQFEFNNSSLLAMESDVSCAALRSAADFDAIARKRAPNCTEGDGPQYTQRRNQSLAVQLFRNLRRQQVRRSKESLARRIRLTRGATCTESPKHAARCTPNERQIGQPGRQREARETRAHVVVVTLIYNQSTINWCHTFRTGGKSRSFFVPSVCASASPRRGRTMRIKVKGNN